MFTLGDFGRVVDEVPRCVLDAEDGCVRAFFVRTGGALTGDPVAGW